MIGIRTKIILAFLLLSVFFFFGSKIALGQDASSQKSNIQACADNNITVADCPAFLQRKVNDLQSQANTLSSQIAVMDNQINLTEARIAANEKQISDLTLDIDTTSKKIDGLQEALNNLSKVLINRIKATYEVGKIEPFHILLSSSDATNFFSRLNYLKIAREHDRKLIIETTAAKNDYSNQKNILEDKKKQIESLKKQQEAYSMQLTQQKQSKKVLLTETQGSESSYQKLLKQAQAQVASLKAFSTSKGGASILPPQSSPDGWYFNQRDERWGNNYIGLSDMRMWEVGCLVTATTMLRKQRGENVSPADVASQSSYYSLTTADMRIPWNDGRFSSVWGSWQNNKSAIDNKLSAGQPVIVGLNAGSFGTHFVVLKSGANGDYIMNDPWEGANLKFSDYYSTGQIYQYGYLN